MPYDPYALAFPADPFTLFSPDVAPGADLPAFAYNTDTGENASPALTWSGARSTTRSFVVTAFDADAPIPGGFWHWAVKDLPATTTGLPRNAGATEGPGLPADAITLPNDLGVRAYSGARPPAGTGAHRLFVAVTALDVDRLELPEGASLAMLHVLMVPHTVGRAVTTAVSHAAAA